MKQEIMLKKNLLGGFDRKQVIDCLNMLQSNENTKVSTEEIESAKKTISTYTEVLEQKNSVIKDLQKQLKTIQKTNKNNFTYSSIKSISEANRIICEAKIKADRINESTQKDIHNKDEKIDIIFKRINSISIEIERIKNTLNQTHSKLSDINLYYESRTDDFISEAPKQTNDNVHQITPPKTNEITKVSVVEDITEVLKQTEENFNSIDNFFAELYKMTNGKLFEQKKGPEFTSNDDFEYEY